MAAVKNPVASRPDDLANKIKLFITTPILYFNIGKEKRKLE